MSDSQSAATGTASYDVVGVFDQAFNQLFADARPVKASIKRTSKLMKHPAETGITRTDHRVINPIEITLSLTLTPETYVDTYHQIESTYNAVDSISVQTKVKLFENFLIAQMPHEEDANHFDTIIMQLHLTEIRYFKVALSSYHATPTSQKKRGNRAGKAASSGEKSEGETKAKGSILYGIFGGGSNSAETKAE